MKKIKTPLVVLFVVIVFISCNKKKYKCTCTAQVEHFCFDCLPPYSPTIKNYSTSQLIDIKLSKKKGEEACEYVKRTFVNTLNPNNLTENKILSSECNIE